MTPWLGLDESFRRSLAERPAAPEGADPMGPLTLRISVWRQWREIVNAPRWPTWSTLPDVLAWLLSPHAGPGPQHWNAF